jgi:hypothetical protein
MQIGKKEKGQLKSHGEEEGSDCNRNGCTGTLEYRRDGECICFLCAPCSACTDAYLLCNECDFILEN